MSIKKRVILSISLIFLLFVGCSSHSNYFTPFISDKIDLSKNRADIIIHDFITIIKAYYPPANSVFQIEQTNTLFAKKVESELRKRGYGLGAIYGKDIKRIPLAWKITPLNKKMIRVSYHIGEVSISRIYKDDKRKYQPFSSFSAVGLDSKQFANLDFSISQDIVTTQNQNSVSSFAKVVANSLKIRSKPTKKSKEIAILRKGEMVSYVEIITNQDGEDWVKLEGGGYMKASYLKF
jgi:hypothetical protein